MPDVMKKSVKVEMTYEKSTPNMNVYKAKALAVLTSVYVHKSFSADIKDIVVTVEEA